METGNAWSVVTSLVAGVTVLLDFLKSALSSLAWPATVMTAMWLFRKDIVSLLSKIAAIKAAGFEASFAHQVQTMEPLHETDDLAGEEARPDPTPPDEPFRQGREPNADAHAGSWEVPNQPPTGEFDFEPSDPNASIVARLKLLRNVKEFAASAWLSSQAKRDFKEARLVAANSASAAVLLAWRAVEGILRDIGFYLDVNDTSVISASPTRRSSQSIMKVLYKRELIDSDAFDRYFDLVRLRNSVAHAEHFSASTEDVREYIDRAQELGVTLTRVLHKIEFSTQPEQSPQGDLALSDDQARQD